MLGDSPHTDLTGSMEPTISPGDVVIDEEIKPMNASVGDIVTFRDPEDQSKLLTHRVVAIRRKGLQLWFTTQGDANNTQEHWRVPARGQIGRVMYTCRGSATSPCWRGRDSAGRSSSASRCCCSRARSCCGSGGHARTPTREGPIGGVG